MSKYMLIMRNSGAAESAADVDMDAMITAMGRFNEQMIEAGVLRGGDGLTDASRGSVVRFTADGSQVEDGAYGEPSARFNGFWILETATQQEAVGWAQRAPLGAGDVLEVRRITDETDFAEHADNEYLQKEKEWRAAE